MSGNRGYNPHDGAAGWRRAQLCASVAGFSAVAEGVDAQRVAGLGNDHTVIAGAQAELSGKASIQLSNVPFSSRMLKNPVVLT
jgi:hypothetical protein